jgi:hypothetical protein
MQDYFNCVPPEKSKDVNDLYQKLPFYHLPNCFQSSQSHFLYNYIVKGLNHYYEKKQRIFYATPVEIILETKEWINYYKSISVDQQAAIIGVFNFLKSHKEDYEGYDVMLDMCLDILRFKNNETGKVFLHGKKFKTESFLMENIIDLKGRDGAPIPYRSLVTK